MQTRFSSRFTRKPSLPLLLLALTLTLVLTAAGVLLYMVLTDPYDCRIAEGVTIGSLDVGGMRKHEARTALSEALENSLYAAVLTVHLPQEDLIISPEESRVQISIRDAVKDAYRCGREETVATQEFSLLAYLECSEEAIKARLTDYASRWDTELTAPAWELKGSKPELSTDAFDPDAEGQTLVLTLGIPSLHLDVEGVYQEILEAYNDSVSLCAAGVFSITPEVTPEALPENLDLSAISQEISTAPTDDSLDMEKYTFVPGAYGYGFDEDKARELVARASYGETLSLPMTLTEPEILGEEVYFRDVLGSCDTKHSANENRNENLRLLCKALDGLILQPGQDFSYNETIGERTAEKGYKPAPAYSGNRLTDAIGGGVCQGSTTLYNCVLLADLEVTERVCHGAQVNYVPWGLDAAVNWGTTDFAFRNSANFPIKITAEVSDGFVKMRILGTDEKDYYIKMTSGYDDSNPAYVTAASYKNKYHKETHELISKEREAFSTYYRNIG